MAYPSIPWWEYFNTILAPQAQLSRDEILVVSVPSYLKDFERLINQTPKRVQANYALWRAAAGSVSYLTDDIRKRQLMYTTELNGKTEREPRWKECVDIVSGSLAISVGSMYVKKYFKEDAKKTALEMVGDIRAEFTKILKKVRTGGELEIARNPREIEKRMFQFCAKLCIFRWIGWTRRQERTL